MAKAPPLRPAATPPAKPEFEVVREVETDQAALLEPYLQRHTMLMQQVIEAERHISVMLRLIHPGWDPRTMRYNRELHVVENTTRPITTPTTRDGSDANT